MKTRTLLILSALTATAILVAGIAMFIRFDQVENTVALLQVGEGGQAGDALVVVQQATEIDGGRQLEVAVRLSGVDDPDGLDGFRLVAPGFSAPVGDGGTCLGFEVEPVDCTLRFDIAAAEGTSRNLVFFRSDQQLRWDVS